MIKLTDILFEYVTKSDMRNVESYADKLFAAAGIDVDFTRHFRQRVNDKRNIKPISSAELIGVFKRTWNKYGKKLPSLTSDAQAVIKDMRSDINMPFVFAQDKDGELDLIVKTVMRKKNFQTTNKVLDV
tara:strand:+ start:399 stop:785 length:387 start_codon:yes stop_codon:yes gene_type:complete